MRFFEISSGSRSGSTGGSNILGVVVEESKDSDVNGEDDSWICGSLFCTMMGLSSLVCGVCQGFAY